MEKTSPQFAVKQSVDYDFIKRIQSSMQRSAETSRPFLVVLLQIANLTAFKNQRPSHVVNSFFRELNSAVRNAVHSSQFVGLYQNGLGLVFENVDSGQVDIMARRLVMLTQHVIKSGRYNDLSSRWSDIIYQFLWPNKPGIIYPCVGWAMYPRDGASATELAKRALHHIEELKK